jgi:hypothetical protein
MRCWTVVEMHELAHAIVAAGDTFYVRRVLRRLERGELALGEVLAALAYPAGSFAVGLHTQGFSAAPHPQDGRS